VTVSIEEEVFRLEVAVDNVAIVEILKSEGDSGRVEARCIIGECVGLAQVSEEFAADGIFEHEIEVELVLEGLVPEKTP
jgi:hypothetical protein